jgi:hypothetical protein
MHRETITREGFCNRSFQAPKFRVLTHLGLGMKHTWTMDIKRLIRYRFNESGKE